MKFECFGKSALIVTISLPIYHLLSMVTRIKGKSIGYPERGYNRPSSCFTDDRFPPQHLLRHRSSFRLVRRLGSGKFSDVFEAVDEDIVRRLKSSKRNTCDGVGSIKDALVVIKCLKPVPERKIIRELLVLSHIAHLPAMAKLIGVCWDDHNTKNCDETCQGATAKEYSCYMPAIILQHAGPKAQWLCHGHRINGVDFATNYLSQFEIKYYLFHLLRALDSLHSHGIMHRDIKPRNVLITRTTEELRSPNNEMESDARTQPSLMLIDFGLADFYFPGQSYNVRVASRHYKAPELLVNFEFYDYSLDMWSVGCMLAGLLMRREPFFRGRDNIDQLRQIASALGGKDLLRYCNRINVTLSTELEKIVADCEHKKPWSSFVSHGCPIPDQCAFDLLDKLLVYDHTKRLTAAEAMNHTYFDDVRRIDL